MNSLQKFVALTVVLLAGAAQGAGGVSAGPQGLETAWVPLSRWARENGFNSVGPAGDGTFILTNITATLRFKNDSQQATVNGVNLWLCDPLSQRDGQACISSLDVSLSIQPVLFPRKNEAGKLFQTICLDPGHGGKDTGGQSGKLVEKRCTLSLAQELEKQLRTAGFNVVLTRTSDKYVGLEDRPELADRLKADLFVSLHFNVSPGGEAKGVEVYCLTPMRANSTNVREKSADTGSLPGNRQDPQNVLLAYELQKSLIKNLNAEDRGVRRARFVVLRPATMPAVLIEGGFMTDSEEGKKIADPKYRAQMAGAIVQGVVAYQHAIVP